MVHQSYKISSSSGKINRKYSYYKLLYYDMFKFSLKVNRTPKVQICTNHPPTYN